MLTLRAQPGVDGPGVPGQHGGQHVVAQAERGHGAGVAGDAGHAGPVGREDELAGEPPQVKAREPTPRNIATGWTRTAWVATTVA